MTNMILERYLVTLYLVSKLLEFNSNDNGIVFKMYYVNIATKVIQHNCTYRKVSKNSFNLLYLEGKLLFHIMHFCGTELMCNLYPGFLGSHLADDNGFFRNIEVLTISLRFLDLLKKI